MFRFPLACALFTVQFPPSFYISKFVPDEPNFLPILHTLDIDVDVPLKRLISRTNGIHFIRPVVGEFQGAQKADTRAKDCGGMFTWVELQADEIGRIFTELRRCCKAHVVGFITLFLLSRAVLSL
jgi:hypothetical protein